MVDTAPLPPAARRLALGLDRAVAGARGLPRAAEPSWTASDPRCYELVEEMGAEGFSCLLSERAGGEGRTFCQFRGPAARAGAWVPGLGPAARRMAVCAAYVRARLEFPAATPPPPAIPNPSP